VVLLLVATLARLCAHITGWRLGRGGGRRWRRLLGRSRRRLLGRSRRRFLGRSRRRFLGEGQRGSDEQDREERAKGTERRHDSRAHACHAHCGYETIAAFHAFSTLGHLALSTQWETLRWFHRAPVQPGLVQRPRAHFL